MRLEQRERERKRGLEERHYNTKARTADEQVPNSSAPLLTDAGPSCRLHNPLRYSNFSNDMNAPVWLLLRVVHHLRREDRNRQRVLCRFGA
jgi:hypothetical protein